MRLRTRFTASYGIQFVIVGNTCGLRCATRADSKLNKVVAPDLADTVVAVQCTARVCAGWGATIKIAFWNDTRTRSGTRAGVIYLRPLRLNVLILDLVLHFAAADLVGVASSALTAASAHPALRIRIALCLQVPLRQSESKVLCCAQLGRGGQGHGYAVVAATQGRRLHPV